MRTLLAGDRRVRAVAGGTLGVLLVGVLIALALPTDSYFTGTNSVAVQSTPVKVKARETLCVPDLQVPAGTGRIRVAAFWTAHRSRAFEGRLEAGRRVLRGRVAPTEKHGRIDLPVERLDAGARSRFCVKPLGGSVKLGGRKEVVGQHPLPTVGGRTVRSEVAIWYLPPKGDKRSRLSLLPRAFRRAALFRPGIVGPWTYALLLLAIPALCMVAIRMLAVRVSGRTRGARTALAVGAVAFACAGTWALLTPPFDAPDEPEHFAYAQDFAETGHAPDRAASTRPPYSSGLATTLDGLLLQARVQQADERPPWLASVERRLDARLHSGGVRGDDGGGFLTSTSTHAPPYYALLAPAYLAAGGADSPFAALTAMRLVSALLAALIAGFTFLALRELFPRQEWVGAAAGLLVAFQPMFGFIAGSVNNDNGVNAAAALLLFLLIRGLRRGLTVPLGLGIGATMVVLPLMKGTGYALLPAVVVALVAMVVRRHSRSELPGYAALAGAFVGLQLAWTAVAGLLDRSAYTTPGGRAPVGSNGLVLSVLKHPADYISYTWQVFLPRLPFMGEHHLQRWPAFDIYVERGWAAFGWYAVKFPHWVYIVIAAVMLLVGALCVAAVWRERQAARARAIELIVLVLALAGVVGGVEAAYQTHIVRPVVAEQGRYAFTAMVPLAAIAVGAAFAFGRRRAPVVASALVALVAGFAVASYALALTRFFM